MERRARATATACMPLSATSRLDGYTVYNASATDSQQSCADSDKVAIAGPMYFGKSAGKNEPLFVVCNYAQHKLAKGTLIGMTVAAAGLGIACIVLGVRCAKKH